MRTQPRTALVASESAEQLPLVTQSSASLAENHLGPVHPHPAAAPSTAMLTVSTSLSSQTVEKNSGDTDSMARLDSTGNCNQCPVILRNGKEHEEECVYVH